TGIPIEEVPGYLERLRRTGLYQAHIVGDADIPTGYLTPNFNTFINALGLGETTSDLQFGNLPLKPMTTIEHEFNHKGHEVKIVSTLVSDGNSQYKQFAVLVDGIDEPDLRFAGSIESQERDIRKVMDSYLR